MIGLSLLALCLPVLAEPTRAAAVAASTTPVQDLAVSAEGEWVAWITSGGELELMDTATWTVTNVAIPSGATATGGVALGGNSAAPMLFAGLSGDAIGQWALAQGEEPVHLLSTPVEGTPLGLAADGGTLYAVLDVEGSGPVATGYEIETFIARYSEPGDLADSGYEDLDVRRSTGEEGDSISHMYVAHGGSQLSRISIGESTITPSSSTENEGNLTIEDVWTEDGGTATWFANSGSTGSTAYLSDDQSTIDLLAPSSPDIGPATGIGGLAANGWLGIAEAESLHVFIYAGGTTLGEEIASIPEAGGATEIAGINGYGFAATAGGTWVLTDLPWVTLTDVSATDVAAEEEFTITFSSDITGSYQVNYQEAGAGVVPEEVEGASGEVEAGAEVTATVQLPTTGADRRYLVEVTVTAQGATEFGRAGAYIDVNEPAPAPTVNASTVSFGDESVRVTFDAFDLDVAQSYTVYLTTVEFESGDYATLGPPYVGPDRDPGVLSNEPDAFGVFDCLIGGLTNGTTYYVAARAIDADDGTYSESPMSDVYAVTPEETSSLSQRLDLESWCGLPLASAGWMGCLAAAAAIFRRGPGRKAAGTTAALALVVLATPGVAQAKPHEDDLTSRSWNFELRYGTFLTQESEELTSIFGTSDNRLLRTDLGWTGNYAEVDFGFGLYSDEGGQTTSSGEASGDTTTLNVLPLALDVTLRFDRWKEQPVVPFVRAGGDFWLWNETWVSPYDADGGGSTTAGSFGWHWGGGLCLLLDSVDPGSASRLEGFAGVNDTYLVAEYRQTYTLGADTLDFTSTDLTIGLKFDY